MGDPPSTKGGDLPSDPDENDFGPAPGVLHAGPPGGAGPQSSGGSTRSGAAAAAAKRPTYRTGESFATATSVHSTVPDLPTFVPSPNSNHHRHHHYHGGVESRASHGGDWETTADQQQLATNSSDLTDRSSRLPPSSEDRRSQLVPPSTTIYCTTTAKQSPRRCTADTVPDQNNLTGYAGLASTGPTSSSTPWAISPVATLLASHLPPLHEPRYHHVVTMFSGLILTSALALFSALDAFLRCGRDGSGRYFGEAVDDDGYVAEAAATDDAAAYGDDGDDDAEAEAEADDYNDDAVDADDDGGAAAEGGGDAYGDDADGGDAIYYVDEAQSCRDAFWTVIVPATIVGLAVGSVAMCLVALPRRGNRKGVGGSGRRRRRYRWGGDDGARTVRDPRVDGCSGRPSTPALPYGPPPLGREPSGDASVPPGAAPSSSASTVGSYAGTDPNRRLRSRRRHLSKCARLLLVSALALAAWVYGIVRLMLEPRNGGYNDSYVSLASVDAMGRVGDNANLYYSTWACLGLSVALVYELAGMTLLQLRSTRQAAAAVPGGRRRLPMADYMSDSTKGIEAVLDWTTPQEEEELDEIRESRSTWYNSLYRLRARTGIWVATLLATLVVYASSTRIWKNIILPAAEGTAEEGGVSVSNFYVCDLVWSEGGDDEGGEGSDGGGGGGGGSSSADLTYETCTRTEMARAAGAASAALSGCAIVAHSFIRRHAAAVAASAEPHRHSVHNRTPTPCGSVLPLPSELGLATLLSIILGLSAIFVTGVNGPAQSVGNLYYATWLSFLLSLRIAVACLEQMCNVWEDAEEGVGGGDAGGDAGAMPSMRFRNTGNVGGSFDTRKEVVTKVVMLSESYVARSDVGSDHHNLSPDNGSLAGPSSKPTHSPIGAKLHTEEPSGQSYEYPAISVNERPKRLRRWCSLAVFSTVCAASAFDSAQNETNGITAEQKYMLILPSAVAILCYTVFTFCLFPYTYIVVNDFNFGGVAAIITFLSWLSNLIVTMHAESSWAVNAIGEIKMANLYYFSWASIITAGLQMSTYVKKRLDIKPRNVLVIAWFALVKVCFVMFGAGYHIWSNIEQACSEKEEEIQRLSFCKRTELSILIGLVGMAVASLVVLLRLCLRESRVGLYIEMVLSAAFVILFAAAAAVITTIGGPGQSVGDLYYATWLSFLVSIGVCKSCYDQLLKANAIVAPILELSGNSVTPFQRMSDK